MSFYLRDRCAQFSDGFVDMSFAVQMSKVALILSDIAWEKMGFSFYERWMAFQQD